MRFVSGRQSQRLWPVLLMLLVAAVVPTACVLWFMGEAMRNERLASRQKLLEAYRAPLVQLGGRLSEHWQARLDELAEVPTPGRAPAAAFAAYLARSRCDGLVLRDAAGAPLYPDAAADVAGESEAVGDVWEAAEALEFQAQDAAGAAGLYFELARSAPSTALMLRAHIAAARCAARSGPKVDAGRHLLAVLDAQRAWKAKDDDGRLPGVDAGLLALELLESDEEARAALSRKLANLAADYRVAMPASQRRLLMERLGPRGGPGAFPTLAAERLTAEYMEAHAAAPNRGQLTATALPEVWQLASAEGAVVGLYRQARIEAEAADILRSESLSGAQVRLQNPYQRGPEPFLALPVGDVLAGWRLALHLTGADPFAAETQRRTTRYLWMGLSVALVTFALTLLVGRYVGRQVKLTRLKNDLIATVSHELKTPLASIRALVDTLLEAHADDPRQTRDYLELIAHENLRLSRLIDNFLAFSRMERHKQAFEFAEVDPAAIVAEVREAAGERFAEPRCRFEVKVEGPLPAILADGDALVTVLLNLLDNAWKYTQNDKQITLTACAAGAAVRFEVSDNGIGLTRRALRRIFDRFYQVDQTLSRQAGGCGLGLSIVQFIVEAHGGAVEVRSRPGEGSTFAVLIPTATEHGAGLRRERAATGERGGRVEKKAHS